MSSGKPKEGDSKVLELSRGNDKDVPAEVAAPVNGGARLQFPFSLVRFPAE